MYDYGFCIVLLMLKRGRKIVLSVEFQNTIVFLSFKNQEFSPLKRAILLCFLFISPTTFVSQTNQGVSQKSILKSRHEK